MGKRIALYVLIAAGLVCLDIFSRYLYSQSWLSSFTLNKQVDPIAVFALIISSLVTIWLGVYVG